MHGIKQNSRNFQQRKSRPNVTFRRARLTHREASARLSADELFQTR